MFTTTPVPTLTPPAESTNSMPIILPEAQVIDGQSSVDGMPIQDVAGAEVIDGRSTVDNMPLLSTEAPVALAPTVEQHFYDYSAKIEP